MESILVARKQKKGERITKQSSLKQATEHTAKVKRHDIREQWNGSCNGMNTLQSKVISY